MLSILTLLMVLVLSILVTRIATVALTHTGLSRQSARFQARSAFTGVGFTTAESEKVVNHPVRRKILLILMLLGNAGIVTAMSTLIVSFIDLDRAPGSLWIKIAVLTTGLILLWAVAASPWVDRHLSALISKLLKQYTRLNVQDYSGMLHLAGEYQIVELQVSPADWLSDRPLKESKLRNEGIVVLGITREDGAYIGAPHGETEVNPHDTLIMYGRTSAIEKLDQRKHGIVGDIQHMQEVDKQKEIVAEEGTKENPLSTGNG